MEIATEKPIKVGMSANTLKLIAIFAMLTDHIAWGFVPTASVSGEIMHIIGRLTAPIMCYFIAEGYHHTHNIKKYALRLGIFALISHFTFSYFETGKMPISFVNGVHFRLQTGVIYTLLLGLISLVVWNSKKMNKYVKIMLIVMICIISIPGDWPCFAVLWILAFGINYGNFKKQMIGFSIIGAIMVSVTLLFSNASGSPWWEQLFQSGVFLAIPLLSRYNGELGGSKNSKWIFYIFYPLHLFILGLIKYGL